MKNDLALKGNVDGVELLIFPSNQLPDKSQRKNEFQTKLDFFPYNHCSWIYLWLS